MGLGERSIIGAEINHTPSILWVAKKKRNLVVPNADFIPKKIPNAYPLGKIAQT